MLVAPETGIGKTASIEAGRGPRSPRWGTRILAVVGPRAVGGWIRQHPNPQRWNKEEPNHSYRGTTCPKEATHFG